MEKLQAKKVLNSINLGSKNRTRKNKELDSKNQQIKSKNNFKKNNATKKSNVLLFENFLAAIKKYKVSYIVLTCFLVASIVLTFLTFSNSTYFVFLKRPKIIENGFLLALIIELFLILLFVNFVLETMPIARKKNDVKNNKKDIEEQNNEIIKSKKNIKKNKFFNPKSIKKCDFKAYFIVFIEILLLILAFNIHSLWLCVFVCFCTFFTLFIHMYKSKKIQTKIIDIVLLLNYLCVLLSFYFIYLYN